MKKASEPDGDSSQTDCIRCTGVEDETFRLPAFVLRRGGYLVIRTVSKSEVQSFGNHALALWMLGSEAIPGLEVFTRFELVKEVPSPIVPMIEMTPIEWLGRQGIVNAVQARRILTTLEFPSCGDCRVSDYRLLQSLLIAECALQHPCVAFFADFKLAKQVRGKLPAAFPGTTFIEFPGLGQPPSEVESGMDCVRVEDLGT